MSAALMSAAMYLPLDPPEKLLLVALADHASDDGSGVYASNGLLAAKTSQSPRNARRVVRHLEEADLVARVGNLAGGRGRAVDYALNAPLIYDLARAGGWTQRLRRKPGHPRHPFPERKADTQGLKADTQGLKADTGVRPTIEPYNQEPPTVVARTPRQPGETLRAWLQRIVDAYDEAS